MGNCCKPWNVPKRLIADRMLPTFDETQNVHEFVRKVWQVKREYKISTRAMKMAVILKLDKKPSDWWKKHPYRQRLTLETLLEELAVVFGTYEKIIWTPDESYVEYHQKKLLEGLMLNLSYAQITESIITGMTKRMPELATEARAQKFQNTTQLLNFVMAKDLPGLKIPESESGEVNEVPVQIKKVKIEVLEEENENLDDSELLKEVMDDLPVEYGLISSQKSDFKIVKEPPLDEETSSRSSSCSTFKGEKSEGKSLKDDEIASQISNCSTCKNGKANMNGEKDPPMQNGETETSPNGSTCNICKDEKEPLMKNEKESMIMDGMSPYCPYTKSSACSICKEDMDLKMNGKKELLTTMNEDAGSTSGFSDMTAESEPKIEPKPELKKMIRVKIIRH